MADMNDAELPRLLQFLRDYTEGEPLIRALRQMLDIETERRAREAEAGAK
ncbi:MAG: hypothetical protein U5K76_12025 [Woeseiaceae bacterium]|nr:hypothetical protein [Woeseiaceae bacterium]